jgi:cytochrome c553
MIVTSVLARMFVVAVFSVAIAGCPGRIPGFSPRMTDSDDHRSATADTCLSCHKLSELPDHVARDDCLRCHKNAPRR